MKKRDLFTVHVAKTKVLTAKLIWVFFFFFFPYADCWFSHEAAHVLFQVTAVREVVSGKSNNEIILVLQYYDYDVERSIQAYLEGNFNWDCFCFHCSPFHFSMTTSLPSTMVKKLQVGNDQEMAQSERKSHSKYRRWVKN